MNMISRLTQPTPAVEPAPAEPNPVAGLRARRRELTARIQALTTALAVLFPNRDVDPKRMAASLLEAAKPFMDLSRRNLDSELDKAEHELPGVVDDLGDAMEAGRRAAVAAMKAKARELAPEHRAAVSRIADALETLVDAMADETRIREQTNLNGVAYLPHLGLPVLGVPSDPNSHVSRWAADARRAGYLE